MTRFALEQSRGWSGEHGQLGQSDQHAVLRGEHQVAPTKWRQEHGRDPLMPRGHRTGCLKESLGRPPGSRPSWALVAATDGGASAAPLPAIELAALLLTLMHYPPRLLM